MSATVNGTIKNIIYERGFGFIGLPGGESVFFHMSALTDRGIFGDLEVGDPVTLEVDDNPRDKGPRAKWVTVMSGAASHPATSGETVRYSLDRDAPAVAMETMDRPITQCY